MIFTLFAECVLAVEFCEPDGVVHTDRTLSPDHLCSVRALSIVQGLGGSFIKMCRKRSCTKHFCGVDVWKQKISKFEYCVN